MSTRFVCLANSFKEGGRCIAGIVLDNNNLPVFENGRPKWIRPICKTLHGEVYTHLVTHLHVLDIAEIIVTGIPELSYQSENVFFNENSIQIIGKITKANLKNICDNKKLIFGNKGKAVHHEKIETLLHSLTLINVTEFKIIGKTYDDTPEKTKLRLIFSYFDTEYDFPITDPAFIYQYQSNVNCIKNARELFLCLSLGIIWQDWHYKLVAGLILH